MIKVKCRTNIDDGRSKTWPEHLQVLPQKGERIAAKSSPDFHLTVSSVFHHEDHVEIWLTFNDPKAFTGR